MRSDDVSTRHLTWLKLRMGAACFVAALACQAVTARAETVDVKYRGPVDLAPFECTDITRSSFVKRICYDKANAYMVIRLGDTYYHYCEIDAGTMSALLDADSVGKFYNANIKSSGSGGAFDCRTHWAYLTSHEGQWTHSIIRP